MTRSELVTRLSERQPHKERRAIECAVNTILEHMAFALERGERIEVRDFGSFEVRRHPPRNARNPKTGAVVNIPERSMVHFKPGKGMKDRVNAARDRCRIKDSG